MNRNGFTLTVMLMLVATIVIAGGICYYFGHRPSSRAAITRPVYPTISLAPTNPPSTIATSSVQPNFSSTQASAIMVPVQSTSTSSSAVLPSSTVDTSHWQRYVDASSGLTFAFPPLGTPIQINDITNLYPGSNAVADIEIAALDPSGDAMKSVVSISVSPNPSPDGTLKTWFESNVDDASGTLLSSGTFVPEQLANGPALVLAGPIPAIYRGGPVANAYVLTSSDYVDTITQSHDGSLADFGYRSSSAQVILNAVLGTVYPDASFSPDQKWIAFENGSIVSWGTDFVIPTATLEIVSSDQSVIKTFTPAQLSVSPSCGCTVQMMGWGNGMLWLDIPDSDQGIVHDFLKIDTADWSIANYPTTIFDDDVSFWFGNESINLDTGRFVLTNLPWTPITDGENPAQDPTIYSVSIYDIQTGTSQIIETTTAETAAPVQATFGSDLKWINDNTLQYYNFHTGGLATTTVSE